MDYYKYADKNWYDGFDSQFNGHFNPRKKYEHRFVDIGNNTCTDHEGDYKKEYERTTQAIRILKVYLEAKLSYLDLDEVDLIKFLEILQRDLEPQFYFGDSVLWHIKKYHNSSLDSMNLFEYLLDHIHSIGYYGHGNGEIDL